MMFNNKLLVLIDIDGTLIKSGISPRKALKQAIFEITGYPIIFEDNRLTGLTDPLIITNALNQLGIPPKDDGLPTKILSRYLEIFSHDYPVATDKIIFPGANELLDYLKTRPVRMGLLTGNVQRGAQIKLAPFNLWRYFDFGVFGDDSADRNELPRLALKKAHKLFSEDYPPNKVIIVGDTVHDLICAHVNQMQSVIVLRHPEWRLSIEARKPEL
ncbi:MAG TPA: HAD hydrolase-like protein, partial [Candidatus Marinimicrobia bacterium]|nr:HAD hydrolase-like protein [Candidatus Neomarinimicrobiota bacterium]